MQSLVVMNLKLLTGEAKEMIWRLSDVNKQVSGNLKQRNKSFLSFFLSLSFCRLFFMLEEIIVMKSR